jgi:hypothetical protein
MHVVICSEGKQAKFGGGMLRRGLVLAAAVLLSGCVSDGVGTEYAAVVQKVGQPRAGQSASWSSKKNGRVSAWPFVRVT